MVIDRSVGRRLFCYFLLGFAVPGILFIWVILFGSGSYQEWVDRFQYELTNRYLFSRIMTDSVLGPLWRDDVFSGNVWAVSIGPKAPALVLVLGRIFHLSPLWLDLIGNTTLYFIAVFSMYVYLRRVLTCCLESAVVTATMFAVTAYWIAMWVQSPDLPMAAAWIPVLLTIAHQIEKATEQKRPAHLVLSMVGLSLAFYGCAIHSVLVSLPITGVLVLAYAWFVFGPGRSVLWTATSLALGVILYSPHLWSIVEAIGISPRGVEPGFTTMNLQGVWNPSEWLTTVGIIISRIAVGHNQYGVYLVFALVTVVWFFLGPSVAGEQPRIRKILRFAAWTSVAIFSIEVFSGPIDYVKRVIPLLGGWHVARFQHFSFVTLLMLFAWMLDRSFYLSKEETLPTSRLIALRQAIAGVGIVGALQVAYSAYRMRLVPAAIYPQNLILYAYLIMYAAVMVALFALLYSGTRRPSVRFNLFTTDAGRVGFLTLVVLSVSLVVSVHAYRPGILPPRVGVALKTDPIMTYAQRYAIPGDISAIKQFNVLQGRVVDLTRPWYADGLGPASESVLYPLAGLRTVSGYSIAYPYWYERFIHTGINGRQRRSRYIVQVEDTGETNFEALGLLDVQYILADRETSLPGYAPVKDFESYGKTLYAVEKGSLVKPAFVSQAVRCFVSDDEALKYIHQSGLRELQAQAVLVSRDREAAALCARKEGLGETVQGGATRIHTHRGLDRVRIEVESSARGILTLSDTYYPGWKVLVNGDEKPLLRTYTALRGVVIEPGSHLVEFVYAPSVFSALSRVSNGLLGLLFLAGLVAWGWSRAFEQGQGSWDIGAQS